MNLDLINNIVNNVKENNLVQNFMKELSNHLQKANNELKQEGLYQVVEMDVDGAYLQDINDNQVSKVNDIPKEILDKIGNDTVLRYENGKYSIDEEMTQKFLDSLVDIKEYQEIKENFLKESDISDIDENMRYEIVQKGEEYTILNYGTDEKNTLKVPNALIPYWAKEGEELYYKNEKFNRAI